MKVSQHEFNSNGLPVLVSACQLYVSYQLWSKSSHLSALPLADWFTVMSCHVWLVDCDWFTVMSCYVWLVGCDWFTVMSCYVWLVGCDWFTVMSCVIGWLWLVHSDVMLCVIGWLWLVHSDDMLCVICCLWLVHSDVMCDWLVVIGSQWCHVTVSYTHLTLPTILLV